MIVDNNTRAQAAGGVVGVGCHQVWKITRELSPSAAIIANQVQHRHRQSTRGQHQLLSHHRLSVSYWAVTLGKLKFLMSFFTFTQIEFLCD